jgi:hypothetical protein
LTWGCTTISTSTNCVISWCPLPSPLPPHLLFMFISFFTFFIINLIIHYLFISRLFINHLFINHLFINHLFINHLFINHLFINHLFIKFVHSFIHLFYCSISLSSLFLFSSLLLIHTKREWQCQNSYPTMVKRPPTSSSYATSPFGGSKASKSTP